MPRHRLMLWAGLSTAAMLLGVVSMASAQDPFPPAQQEQGTTTQDPFDAAEKAGGGPSVKDASGAADKSPEKAVDRKTAARKPEPEFVRKTLQEWQRTLPRAVFQVTRLKSTEPPFSGRYATGHFHGTFLCACCDAVLFSSQSKFDSGTGWPSFWQPVQERAIDRALDNSEAEPRIEVMCHRCGAHLGHVFDDGPPPTGLRFCINSLSLKLRSTGEETARPAAKTAGKAKVKTTRARSRGVMKSARGRGTGKATQPAASDPVDTASDGSRAPATGKADGDGR